MSSKPQVIVAGSYVTDYCFSTKVIPRIGETRIGQFHHSSGGKGFNQAIACSRVGISTLFIGATGFDAGAKDLEKFLASESLNCNIFRDESSHTGAAGIMVDQNGNNQIVVSLGANLNLPMEHIFDNAHYFDSAKIFLCQLEANYESMKLGLKLAKQKGLISILNPAPINEAIEPDILEYVDILTPNELEFTFLMNHFFSTCIEKNVNKLSDRYLDNLCRKFGDTTVIITLGEDGCFLSRSSKDGGGCERIPAFSVDAVDTTGAGDSFNGGLAAGLIMSHNSISESITIANAMGSLTALKQGTATAMPNQSDVGAFLKKAGVQTHFASTPTPNLH